MRCLLVLLALAALAAAQTCNVTSICAKETQSCSNTQAWSFVQCADGTACVNNVCQRRPQLGEACSDTTGPSCWDADWDIECSGGFCRFKDIYGPADNCKPTDTNYVNGGCLSGLTCDSNTKKCSSVAAGGQCDNNNVDDDVCAPGSYCDTNNDVCAARKALNQPCNTHYECIPTLICTARGGQTQICQEPFVGAAGAGCDSNLDCGADLLCNDNDVCAAPQADGQNCLNGAFDCLEGADCECSEKKLNGSAVQETTPAECVNQFGLSTRSGNVFNSKDAINAYKSMQSCLANNNCHDFWMSRGQLDLNAGPNQCIQRCLRDAFPTGFTKSGSKYNTCSSAAGLLPALFALVALLAALLF